jgi:hypothetical protein
MPMICATRIGTSLAKNVHYACPSPGSAVIPLRDPIPLLCPWSNMESVSCSWLSSGATAIGDGEALQSWQDVRVVFGASGSELETKKTEATGDLCVTKLGVVFSSTSSDFTLDIPFTDIVLHATNLDESVHGQSFIFCQVCSSDMDGDDVGQQLESLNVSFIPNSEELMEEIFTCMCTGAGLSNGSDGDNGIAAEGEEE